MFMLPLLTWIVRSLRDDFAREVSFCLQLATRASELEDFGLGVLGSKDLKAYAE